MSPDDIKSLYACFLCLDWIQYAKYHKMWAGRRNWGDYDLFWDRYKIIPDKWPRSAWRRVK